MSDWVHCNYCYIQPVPGSGKLFFLTNCGHIYCQPCVEKGAKGNCKVCGSTCTTIQLSSHMKPEVEMFFTDPWQLFAKHSKQLSQVIEFQKSHRQRLQKHQKDKVLLQSQQLPQLQELTNKYNNAVAAIQRMETELSKLQQENLYLKGVLTSRQSSNNQSRPSQNVARSMPYPQPPSSCSSSGGRRPNTQTGNSEGVLDQTPLSGISRNRTPLQNRLTFQPTLMPMREPTSEPPTSSLGRMSHIRTLMNHHFSTPTMTTPSTTGN